MSTIKLYSSTNTSAGAWKLIPGKLFKIDSFSDYLAQFTPLVVSKVQYIRHGLDIFVKLDLSQTKAQPNATSGYKYMSIQNTDEGIVYYFIDKATWRSANCVEFHLIMDVLNTYQDGSDYVFKANTRIIREHKDRFYRKTLKSYIVLGWTDDVDSGGSVSLNQVVEVRDEDVGGNLIFKGKLYEKGPKYCSIEVDLSIYDKDSIDAYFDGLNYQDPVYIVNEYGNFFAIADITYEWQYQYAFYRKIDYVNENINPILIRNNDKNIIEDLDALNQNWYLLYRNQNDPDPDDLINPVECYLIPEEETDTDVGVVVGGRLYPSWLEEGKTYLFDLGTGSGITATLSNGVATSDFASWDLRLIITKAGNKINVMFGICWNPGVPTNWIIKWQYDDIDYIDFDSVPVPYNVYTNPTIDFNFLWTHSFSESFTNTLPYTNLNGIQDLDRADAKNIKCIKLPYCPYGLDYYGNIIHVDGVIWERASFNQASGTTMYALHLLDTSIKLEKNLAVNSNSLNPFSILKSSTLTPSIDDERTTMLDSKMYHSEFYAPTYVYDSFSLKVELETCQLDYYVSNGVNTNTIKFTMTSTINSKFMFTLTSYVADKNTQNFYNVIPIARNNEIVLYNVPYINYIRSGYNYDVKNKNIQTGSSWIGVGLSALGIGASLLVPSAPLKVAGVVGSLVSMASAIKGAVTTTMQGEENLKAKLLQAENQTASVKGSDDVDLMSEYCGNKLQYMIYKPTPIMESMLNDLFYYAGYNSGRMGVPNHNTRCNFDYLECDAVLESAGANIPQEIIDEIKNCYKVGVTFIHKSSRTSNKWDIEQKYENWENSLLED